MNLASIFKSWKQRANGLKEDVYALALAVKDPRVPWYAKVLAVIIVGYVLSPIDPIPDFIPIIGYFDELIVVPLGIIILGKMIPEKVWEECRKKAKVHRGQMKGKHWVAASIIILAWFAIICFIIRATYLRFFMV
jgi:uncharacterized membrane protein YkvA (DUF1232 family)